MQGGLPSSHLAIPRAATWCGHGLGRRSPAVDGARLHEGDVGSERGEEPRQGWGAPATGLRAPSTREK